MESLLVQWPTALSYFMANTQLDKVAGGRIKSGARLEPVQILKIEISH